MLSIGLFGVPEYYIYEMFDISILFLSSLAFYVLGFVLTMFLLWLFMFGYAYNSYLYGFSYLSLGVMFVIGLLCTVPLLFSKEKIPTWFAITLIALIAMGVIFSYCLFVPGVFAAVCLYIFVKDLEVTLFI